MYFISCKTSCFSLRFPQCNGKKDYLPVLSMCCKTAIPLYATKSPSFGNRIWFLAAKFCQLHPKREYRLRNNNIPLFVKEFRFLPPFLGQPLNVSCKKRRCTSSSLVLARLVPLAGNWSFSIGLVNMYLSLWALVKSTPRLSVFFWIWIGSMIPALHKKFLFTFV